MEEGFYWIEIPETRERWGSGGPTIGKYNRGGYFHLIGQEEVVPANECVIGPRVKWGVKGGETTGETE